MEICLGEENKGGFPADAAEASVGIDVERGRCS